MYGKGGDLSYRSRLGRYKAISRENSLICPNLKQASHASLFLSLNLFRRYRNTIGFIVSTAIANTMQTTKILGSNKRLNCAPSVKKNSIKKKSLRGFNLSAI